MRNTSYVLLLLVLLMGRAPIAHAQPQLAGSIGLDAMPADNEGMCFIPKPDRIYYYSTMDSTGLAPGTLIPDFTLFTADSQGVTASQLLAKGKPLLIVAGSYTCDVFRDQMPQLNQLYSRHSKDLSIYIVYTVEAHPIVDTCPYVDSVWSIPPVLYRQPQTYGARRALVDTMLQNMTSPPILAPVIIDGPCNMWWKTFGPAPNNAYLIDIDGKVIRHEGWFNNPADSTHSMTFAVDSLLAARSGSKGVRQPHLSQEIAVWPNPVAVGAVLHVAQASSLAPARLAPTRFVLSDVLGRPILTENVPEDGSISLQTTSPGAYYYRLDQDGSVTTGRLIVSP